MRVGLLSSPRVSGGLGSALGDIAWAGHNCPVTVRRLALYATWLSLAWAEFLTVLAAAGNTWVLDRVSGGYFAGDTMPMPIRVAYGAMALLMLGVAWLAFKYYINDVTRRQRNLGRFIILVFTLSTIVNAISRSNPERYNAIGAAITVVGIAILRRRPSSSYVDLRTRR